MKQLKKFYYGKDTLTLHTIIKLSEGSMDGIISKEVQERINRSHGYVKAIVNSDRTVYGVNTGFGPLCNKKISPEDTKILQYNILKSHSSGVGEPIPQEITKIMMILKIHVLSRGYSGISLSTLERILWHIENNIIPVVPQQGSVGASGDLTPLSHLFLPLIGYGEIFYKGKRCNTKPILDQLGLHPIELGPKEGLALINGTQFIAAYTIKALQRLYNCLDNADIIGAMTLEGILGSIKPFDPKLHELRPFPGTCYVAHRLRMLLKNSEMVQSHQTCSRVQDPYSVRCIPQVHGASREAWRHLKEITEIEINSVTDNPIILDKETSISGGNFHGQPMALPIDYAAIAASELGNISDRRVYLLLEGGYKDLPQFLMQDTGLNSGFMIPQYTSAALASENKNLCFPASVDSIPTSLGQEDHVSMGSIGARKLNTILDNLENILAVELLCAAQAFDFRHPLKSSSILEACHAVVRNQIDHADNDRVFASDIIIAKEMVRCSVLVQKSFEIAEKEGIPLKGDAYELFGIH